MTTWIEQRVDALEARLADLGKQVRALSATELVLAGAGSPQGIVNAVQGTHYWDITNQVEYVNVSIAGTPPEGTDWGLLGGAAPPPALPHNILSVTHPDTTPAAVVRGDVLTGQGALGATWRRLGIGAATRVLKSDGADAAWGQVDHSELSGVGANDHHAAFTAADHTAIGDGAPHHVRYTDGEALTQANAAVATHVGLADPHAQYQKESEKGAASGYASLDAGALVPVAQLPAATDAAQGAVELATVAETKTATSAVLAVTPAGLAGVVDLVTPASDGKMRKSGAGVLEFTAAGAYQLDANASGGVLVRAAGTPLTAGRVPFASDGNTLADEAGFSYDSGTNDLSLPAGGDVLPDGATDVDHGIDKRLRDVSGPVAVGDYGYNPLQLFAPVSTWYLGDAIRDDFFTNNITPAGSTQWDWADAGLGATTCNPQESTFTTRVSWWRILSGANTGAYPHHAIAVEPVSGATSSTIYRARLDMFGIAVDGRCGFVLMDSAKTTGMAWWWVWTAVSQKFNLVYATYGSANAWLSQAGAENSSVAYATDWTVRWTSSDITLGVVGPQMVGLRPLSGSGTAYVYDPLQMRAQAYSGAGGHTPAYLYLFAEGNLVGNLNETYFDFVNY